MKLVLYQIWYLFHLFRSCFFQEAFSVNLYFMRAFFISVINVFSKRLSSVLSDHFRIEKGIRRIDAISSEHVPFPNVINVLWLSNEEYSFKFKKNEKNK